MYRPDQNSVHGPVILKTLSWYENFRIVAENKNGKTVTRRFFLGPPPPMEVQKIFWNASQRIRWGLISIPRVIKITFCEPFSKNLKAQISKIFIFSVYICTHRADKKFWQYVKGLLGHPKYGTNLISKSNSRKLDKNSRIRFNMVYIMWTIKFITKPAIDR